MIRALSVTKAFGPQRVLDSVTLELPAAQTHVLLGSSGCGKSTLLRIILGLIPADSGRVLLGETEMSPSTQLQLARRVGYVIQDGGLFPHLTATANVTLAARTFEWPSGRIEARFRELQELVGLDSVLLGQYPAQLSGGQRQRVALMRALMLDPAYLLLDEPLGALDPIVRASLQAELKRIFNSLRKTVFLVTHDISEAAFFGHTITLLNSGRVEQHGTFGDLASRPSTPFVTEFLNAQRPSQWVRELL